MAAVHLPPGEPAPVPADVLSGLPEAEQRLARALTKYRQVEFVGGRLAFHALVSRGALEVGPRGEPMPSDEALTVSISHKRHLAVCLVAPRAQGWVGVDLETADRERLSIASHVLRAEEQLELEALPQAQRWARLQRAFALKEATYKAIHPQLLRYVRFHEARVRDEGTQVQVELHLSPAPPQALSLEACIELLQGADWVALVRARPAG